MRIKAGYFAIAIFGALLLLRVTVQAAPSKGESLLNKGDSIAVYVDAEDFDAIKAAKKGAIVKLKVLENVVRSGEKLINKGDRGICNCHRAQPRRDVRRRRQRQADHRFDPFQRQEQSAPQRSSLSIKGKSSTPKTIISVVLFPIGWLIKGGDIEFPEGKNVYKPVVAEDTPVYYQR